MDLTGGYAITLAVVIWMAGGIEVGKGGVKKGE